MNKYYIRNYYIYGCCSHLYIDNFTGNDLFMILCVAPSYVVAVIAKFVNMKTLLKRK